MYLKQFEFSCEHFQGFQGVVDLDVMNTNEEVCKYAIISLKSELSKLNLLNQLEKLKSLKYHIHKPFGELLTESHKEKIWVCSHKFIP